MLFSGSLGAFRDRLANRKQYYMLALSLINKFSRERSLSAVEKAVSFYSEIVIFCATNNKSRLIRILGMLFSYSGNKINIINFYLVVFGKFKFPFLNIGSFQRNFMLDRGRIKRPYYSFSAMEIIIQFYRQ